MDAHTPAPWKASNGVLYAQWSIPGQWHGLPSSEANLRLQAAAPDLLAALEDAALWMEQEADSMHPRITAAQERAETLRARAAAYRAAIARAKGA